MAAILFTLRIVFTAAKYYLQPKFYQHALGGDERGWIFAPMQLKPEFSLNFFLFMVGAALGIFLQH